MVLIAVKCPVCKGTDVSKNGRTRQDVQRYICNDRVKAFTIGVKCAKMDV